MRSLADLLGYAPLPADVSPPYFVPLVAPATPFSMGPAATLDSPVPYLTPANLSSNSTGQTLNSASTPATPWMDPENGGILGPLLKNGWPPSQGILSGQVPDSLPINSQGTSSGPSGLSTSADDWSFGGIFHPLPLSAIAATAAGSPDTDLAPTTPDTKPAISEPTLGPPRPSLGTQPNVDTGQRPEPSLLPRIWGRVKDNFSGAYETPLGPGPEFRALVRPWTTPKGTWTDGITWPGRLASEILFLRLPELIDAAARGTGATYYSAIDAFVEQLVSDGLPRDDAELFGRDLKAMPEAFAGAPRTVWPGTPPAPIHVIRQFPGQLHHAISKLVFDALERHPNLRGYYEYRDPRFVTRAVDQGAHRGWWGWHKPFDKEVAEHIDTHRDLTPEKFEAYLRLRYDQPDMVARFPNGLWKPVEDSR